MLYSTLTSGLNLVLYVVPRRIRGGSVRGLVMADKHCGCDVGAPLPHPEAILLDAVTLHLPDTVGVSAMLSEAAIYRPQEMIIHPVVNWTSNRRLDLLHKEKRRRVSNRYEITKHWPD
jgi:hypothetical protein